jgi:putative transposon-encoded protein
VIEEVMAKVSSQDFINKFNADMAIEKEVKKLGNSAEKMRNPEKEI